MRALHRIKGGELLFTPVRGGLFALTRRAAPTIRRCRGLQTKQCGQLSDRASPVNGCRESPQTYVADFISGLPGMGWAIARAPAGSAISRRYAKVDSLDQVTAGLQQQLRPAPSALYGTLPGEACGYVWIAMSSEEQSRSSSGRTSPLAVISDVHAGWSHCHCRTRWTSSTAESNACSRSLVDRLCGPFAALACQPLPSATVRAHLALCSSHAFCRRVCRLAKGKARPKRYAARFLDLTTLEKYRGT